jgi:DNA-binding response OmpR family regulator
MSKPTVLIVDDEAPVRRILEDALERINLQIEVASTGGMALKRLAEPGIDLLLLDIQLGDIDGVDVMTFARQRWPQMPIIMLTAHGSLSSAIAAVRAQVADYLLKPVSISVLRDTVQRTLSNHRRQHIHEQRLKTLYAQMDLLLRDTEFETESSLPLTTPRQVYESGPLLIDVQQHIALLHNQPIAITPSEFIILQELLREPGTVIPCLRLAQAINQMIQDEEEARLLIRPHIGRLRRKIERNPQEPVHLVSVRGLGYRWVAEGS